MSNGLVGIIYEGESYERKIFDNIDENFFDGNIVPIFVPAGQNIFMLFQKMSEDDFETDIIEVIRESSQSGAESLEGYERDNFSEIYLFLDHDIHHGYKKLGIKDKSDILLNMIEIFDNETENGKIYINYPMCESLRDLKNKDICNRRCLNLINENKEYKRKSSIESDFTDMRKYSKNDWKLLSGWFVCRANCLINKVFTIPNYYKIFEDLTQMNILVNQNELCIKDSKVMILNSIPLFLVEYYGESYYEELIDLSELIIFSDRNSSNCIMFKEEN